jgi:solute carrier family 25 oxoglutarate transporter 11
VISSPFPPCNDNFFLLDFFCFSSSFYATARIGLYEVFRDKLAQHYPIDFPARVGLATVAGALAAVVACPAEVSLVRMSNDKALPLEQRRNYTSVVDAAVS